LVFVLSEYGTSEMQAVFAGGCNGPIAKCITHETQA